jgi:hypothetical protein
MAIPSATIWALECVSGLSPCRWIPLGGEEHCIGTVFVSED